MEWKQGKPVATEADMRDWIAWKREAARERQRRRRRSLCRVDYETSEQTKRFLVYLQRRHGPIGVSAILDAIVARWAASWQAGREPELW